MTIFGRGISSAHDPRDANGANLEERRNLLLTMLDAVYVDSKENMIVAVKPKAPFKPVFSVATTKEGSEVVLVHDPEAKSRIANQPPPDGQEADADSCSWWRRGRVELATYSLVVPLLADRTSPRERRRVMIESVAEQRCSDDATGHQYWRKSRGGTDLPVGG